MVGIRSYLEGVRRLMDLVDQNAVERLIDALEQAWRIGAKVILMGNGGSSSTASHIVNDLQKCIQLESGRALRAMCLTDCTPLVMAWGNDTEFANVFAPQIECWAEPGDLVIGISGSGNSANVIRAVEMANDKGALTFGLAGCESSMLARTAQDCIVVRSESMQQIEDLHMILLHAAFTVLRERTRIPEALKREHAGVW